MTLDEVIDLLTVAAVFDFRTIGEADARAWHAALGDLAFGDSRSAVIGHYRDSRDRVMPADIRQRVKAIRRDRLDRAILPAPDTGDQAEYRAELKRRTREIADGFDITRAIG
jgi:hypothetical protein